MLQPTKVYVTPDDFYNYFGKDLRNLLRSDDNESNQAERFIAMVTEHLMAWIDDNTFRNLHYDCLTPFQLGQFQRAILAQCYYTYKEGAKALGLSSGVDDERGVILDLSTIKEVEVCQATIEFLTRAGLFNLTVKNRPRYLSGYPEYGFYDPEPCPPQPQPQPTPPTPQQQPAIAGLPGMAYTEVDD